MLTLTESLFIKFVDNTELGEPRQNVKVRISLQNDLDKLRNRLK